MSEQEKLAVYPWVADADGLAAILRRPLYWARVFHSPDNREAVRRALKRADQRARFAKDNDQLVGEVVVSLLESRARRGLRTRPTTTVSKAGTSLISRVRWGDLRPWQVGPAAVT